MTTTTKPPLHPANNPATNNEDNGDDDASKPPKPAISTQRRVAGAAGIMMGAILFSRILGLVRESVIAHQFGQGKPTDVYNAAFTLPDLLFFLIAGGALSGAFIPVFSEYIELKKEKEAWRIFSVVASVMFLVVTCFITFSEVFTPPLVALTSGFVNVPGGIQVPHGISGLAQVPFLIHKGWLYMIGQEAMPSKIFDTVRLTRIVLPAQICFFLGGLMMGTLQARGNPWGQALGPIVYNFCIILGAVFLTHRFGIAGLCYGAVVGAILGNLLLQWYLVRKSGGKYEPGHLRKYWRHEGVVKVWRLMLPVILGLALPQVSTIIGRMFAGSLGDGPVSAFMNANKLMQVPLGVFAQATAIALLPIMSAQAARMKAAQQSNNPELARTELGTLRDSVNFGIRSILFLTVPSSILMYLMAMPFVQLVFQSGEYSLENAHICAWVLRWFAIGIFAWSAHSIITRGFYALQDSKTPIIVGTLVTIIFIPLNFPLKNLMGVSGLALATSIAATIHMLSMLFLLRLRLGGLDDWRLLLSVSKTVFASFLTAVLCALIYNPLYHRYLEHAETGGRLHAALVLAICIPFCTLMYGALALALRMEEVNVIKRILNRLAGRRIVSIQVLLKYFVQRLQQWVSKFR